MNRFQRVKDILDAAVGGPTAVVHLPHRAFWRDRSRDDFVRLVVQGLPLVTLGDGDGSNLVKALRGQAPFGEDVGTPTAEIRRMPAGRPPVPPERIEFVARWIDDGCPDEDEEPPPRLQAHLHGAASGEGFVIVSNPDEPLHATLTLRTTDGSDGEVLLRQSATSGATLLISPSTVRVSATPVEVRLQATTASARRNDTTVEILRGDETLATFEITAIAAAVVRFEGRFQCRLATDPDPWDHPWGVKSSLGSYAVQGPDPEHPDEPPLDRIIRFHDPVALRPLCAPVGVLVKGVEAEVGGATVRFTRGDPLIGLPVELGPACKFEGRNRTFAPDGFEPISPFQLRIGSVFAGASAPGVPRETPADPPGSTAPYADGMFELDVDLTPWPPSQFGFREQSWRERSWKRVAIKLAQLVAQQPTDDRAARIRDRRLREHTLDRLSALAFAYRFLERYTGLVDRDLAIDPKAVGALAYLGRLPAVEFFAEMFDFDSDCQTAMVTGTLGMPVPREPAPPEVRRMSRLRRHAALDGVHAESGEPPSGA
jgi:hypothetical protein